jgi:hypothetical protein
MKVFVASLIALCLAAGLAGNADAASRKKHQHVNALGKAYRTTARQQPPSGNGDYYEHILEKVPFGSQRWWSIYDEQHGTPN